MVRVNELEAARQMLRAQVDGLEAERLLYQESRVLSQNAIESLARAVDTMARAVENQQRQWEDLHEINRQNMALHAQSLAMATYGVVVAEMQRARLQEWERLAANLVDWLNGAGPVHQN